MSYHITTTVAMSFDEAIDKVTAALKERGFGVLTEIDVKATLKKKLDVDFRKYRILGACNPPLAHRALQADDKIGVLLPCNVIVQETATGRVEVSAVNPLEAMKVAHNPDLGVIAAEVQAKLEDVIAAL